MRKHSLIVIFSLFLLQLTAGIPGEEKDKSVIKEIIQAAYVDGLQNKGDLEATRSGFHEGFELLGIYNNNLTKYPIYSWLEYATEKKAENSDPPSKEEIVTCKFLDIDITGNAAVAKIELYKGGKHIFTDYLSLYQFKEGWRIVSKIYYRIPEEKSEEER